MTYYEWIKTLPIEVMAEFLSVVTNEPCKLCDAPLCRKGYECKGESVSEALASLVNNLWQSLTEEERKQIKEILSE